MAKTIIGLFEDKSEADKVVKELKSNNFSANEVITAGQADASTIASLMDRAGVPAQDARFYETGVQQGDTLVVIQTEDTKAARATDILNKYTMVDIDRRMESYTQAGTSNVGLTSFDADGTVIPIVEEELKVGKRQVQRGGVRVVTRITETPVEQDVTLRAEHVHVERRPVDRAVTDADLSAFKEGTLELTETAEEAVVSKQARVVEEVTVGKTSDEHTETISDTVRRTDVDVEQLGATTTASNTTVTSGVTDDSDSYFQTYYTKSLANSGYTYDQYRPVFDYGTSLRADKRYSGKDWSAIEGDARTEWEAKNPGTWSQFKDSIRYAWDRVTNKA